MRASRSRIFATASVVATVLLANGRAAATTTSAPHASERAAWMPDVAERLASLEERIERADVEARSRRNEEVARGQWWRSTIVPPSPGRPR